MRYILALFVVAAPVHAQDTPLLRAALVGYAATAIVDNVETHVVLTRGGVERNPLLAKLGGQHPTKTVAINGAADGLTLYALKRIYSSHPKLAIAALLGSTAFRGWVDYHDFRTIRAMR